MRRYKTLSIVLFVIGLFLVINSESGIVGAAIGVAFMSSTFNLLLGVSLMFISSVLFLTSESGLEAIVKKNPKNFKEAIEMNRLKDYIHRHELIPETNEPYKKHTHFVGRKISDDEFLRRVGNRSQYHQGYTPNQIVDFERKVAWQGRGNNVSNPHKIVVYGISDLKRGPTGAHMHELVFGIAVELQERNGKIYFHGYPIPIEDIPEEIRKRIHPA